MPRTPSAAFMRRVAEARAERERVVCEILSALRTHRADIEADEADRAAGAVDAVPRFGFVGYPGPLVAEAYERFTAERRAERAAA